uniref:Uncharacterized protein n=1 Tax=Anguilla anguilla TaxID=7936 RepID=A0A0E9XW44_ANGAN
MAKVGSRTEESGGFFAIVGPSCFSVDLKFPFSGFPVSTFRFTGTRLPL